MKGRAMNILGVAMLIFAGMISNGYAGWVFTEMVENNRQMTYIQKNWIKFERSDHIAIFDLNENMLHFANPKEQTYWSGTSDEFQQEIQKGIEVAQKMMEEQLAQLPAEQRESIRKAMKSQIGAFTDESAVQIDIKKTGITDQISGYAVEKYEIWVNGQPRQDQWIAKAIRVEDDLNVDKFQKFVEVFRTNFGTGAKDALTSQKVLNLIHNGWPLRRIDYDEEGYKEVTDTISAEQKSLPKSVFELPKGFRKIKISDLFSK